MWWGEFERLFNEEFTIKDKRKIRVVQSEHKKLRILCKKVTADFIPYAKAYINN